MKELFELMKSFEKRNNISINVTVCSDESASVEEFWEGEPLTTVNNTEELYQFLRETKYKLDVDGRCFSPVQLETEAQ